MKLKNWKIGSLLKISVAIICILVIALGIVADMQNNKINEQTVTLFEHPFKVRRAISNIKIVVLNLDRNLENSKDTENKYAALEKNESFRTVFDEQCAILYSKYLGPKTDIDTMTQYFISLHTLLEEYFTVAKSAQSDINTYNELRILHGKIKIQVEEVLNKIEVIDRFAYGKANELYTNSNNLEIRLNKQLLIIVLVILFIIIIGFAIIYTNINLPLKELTIFAQSFHDGNFHVRCLYESKNEMGILAGSFNALADNIEQRIVLNTKIAEISKFMLSNLEEHAFFGETLKYLMSNTGSQMSAVYLLSANKQNYEHFESIGINENARTSFSAVGFEGEFGAVLATKKVQHIKNTANTKFIYNTTTGSFIPNEIITIPITLNNDVIAIISLASLGVYNNQSIIFIESIVATLSARIEGLMANRKLLLYAKELEQSNDELESQALKLKASEEELISQQEELRTQQEELEQVNQFLEEKSQLLEEKNQMVNEKNIELEATTTSLHDKSQELALSNKYKSEFLSNMSHELRTPLNSILLLSKFLSKNKNGNLTKEQMDFSLIIHNSGKSLLELINDVLDLSKIESGKMELGIEPFEVDTVIKNMQDLFTSLFKEKGIEFIISKEENIESKLISDQSRIEQVLKNFLSNAHKFTEHGSVSFIIRNLLDKERKLLSLGNKKFIAFEIKDTGIGISKEKQDIIFEAFNQGDGSTHRKYGGTGLGLSISRQIARLLGGEVLLETELEKGSSFIMLIPIEISDEDIVPIKINSLIEPVKVKKTELYDDIEYISTATPDEIQDDRLRLNHNDKIILIVEDDVAFATALMKNVQHRGYKVIVAVSGGDALDYAKKYKPIGILLDLQLPVKNGWKVMKELKDDYETKLIPVHIMSSHDIKTTDTIIRGAVDFLHKPFAINDLGKVFDKIEHISSGLAKKILIVDDNQVHTDAISRFISDKSKTCLTAKTAKEGYEKLSKENIDCIVLDMGLPDETGYEFLEKIKNNSLYEKIPVIVYTGSSLSISEEKKLKQYANAIVIKTVDSFKRLSSEISLFLHLVEENTEEKSFKEPYLKDVALNGKHILIVDDDARNIFSITKLLEDNNIKVSSASDGREGLAILNSDASIDLVLMDMMMPNMDGYDTTKNIRMDNKFSRLPVIAITAKAMLGDREKCIEAGANDYITKPVDSDQLLTLLRVWLYNSY